MKPEHLQLVVNALENLYSDYLQGQNQMNGQRLCCLCSAMNRIAAELGTSCCAACPWVVQTGKKCTDNYFRLFGTPYDKRVQAWIDIRLGQLPSWIAGYRMELEKFTMVPDDNPHSYVSLH